MSFKLRFTAEADNNLLDLENAPSQSKRLKAVRKALGYLENNPRHPSLNTHKYESLSKEFGLEIYVEYFLHCLYPLPNQTLYSTFRTIPVSIQGVWGEL